ncbi:MAG: type IV pilus assembly protein PilM [bacterium]|nr:type IV pilus assembly protein PilM [bacterium]
MNFFKHPNRAMGLDISDISLKLVQMAGGVSAGGVQAYSELILPKEIISGDKIINPNLLTQTIKQAISSPKFGKVTTPYVIASLPEAKCFVRVIQMPALSGKEAAEAIPWEAEAYIPIPISQVYLDWLVLNPSESTGADAKMTVLITAAPKDYVDGLVEVLKKAGLQPVALEAESQATARSVVGRGTQETVLIADIDTVRTSLIIYEKDVLQFTSSLPIAGNMMTESIAKALSLGFEEAENLKRQVGVSEETDQGTNIKVASKVRKALVPILDNLVAEIKNTIRFYEEHNGGGSRISKLFLVGGSSKLKHLPSFLHEKLTHESEIVFALRSLPGIKVELGNPWVNVLQKGQTPPMSRENSLSFATAIGLSMRETE